MAGFWDGASDVRCEVLASGECFVDSKPCTPRLQVAELHHKQSCRRVDVVDVFSTDLWLLVNIGSAQKLRILFRLRYRPLLRDLWNRTLADQWFYFHVVSPKMQRQMTKHNKDGNNLCFNLGTVSSTVSSMTVWIFCTRFSGSPVPGELQTLGTFPHRQGYAIARRADWRGCVCIYEILNTPMSVDIFLGGMMCCGQNVFVAKMIKRVHVFLDLLF